MVRFDYENKHDSKNSIFILCGPSGVGKTSLKRSILERHLDIKLCPSITTRPESKVSHGIKEYYYLSEREYEMLHSKKELITKKIRQFGFYYGINPAEITSILDMRYHVLLETTLWGVEQLKNRFNNVVSIFVAPPSFEELKRRLKNRNREDDENIGLRLNLAEQILSSFRKEMTDYYVINEYLPATISIINSIVDQEKTKFELKK
jgi:guanylate kinase